MAGHSAIAGAIEQPLATGRRTLWVGFGCILLLMVIIGFDVAFTLSRATAQNAALVKSFRARDQVLDELRNITIRSGTMLRDYLSESDTARAAAQASDIEAARQQSEQLLDAYAQQTLPDETQARTFAELKRGVEAYWKSLAPVLAWDGETRRRRGESYRRDAVGPLRSEVLRLGRTITRLNEQQLDAGEQRIGMDNSRLRLRLIAGCFIGVALAGVLALLVLSRIARLERMAAQRYGEVVRARVQLAELAASLENAQEEERRRLARELHDEVGQTLSSLLVELGRLEGVLPPGGAVGERLASLRQQAEASVRSIRDMALLLRPSMLDDLGLVAALKWQGREVGRRTGLRVRVEASEGDDELPDSHRTCVYRVVQEALANASRHARAETARVTLLPSVGTLDVRIEDDGAGFDPATEKGLGLLGMQERVARLGGKLTVDSAPGQGTRIHVHLPVPGWEKAS